MKPLQKLTDNIPLWVYNILTLLSSLIALLSFLFNIILAISGKIHDQSRTISIVLGIIFICCFIILCVRVNKYRKLSKNRLVSTSRGFHSFTHSFRNSFFDILHLYKIGQLTNESLTLHVERCIKNGLDSLCNIMEDFTGQKVSACIKLIECTDDSGEISLDTATTRIFCRSTNSSSERISYDNGPERAHMYIKDDTALMRIVGNYGEAHDHFYCGDLDKESKISEEINQAYHCPTPNRSKYYNGTMILPIRIPFDKLYYFKQDKAYHILGFLCVDSLSKNAFTDAQEDDNCSLGNAFADEFYVILSKYRHYLNKLN